MSKITIDRQVLVDTLEWFKWLHDDPQGVSVAPRSSSIVKNIVQRALDDQSVPDEWVGEVHGIVRNSTQG